MTYVFFAEGFEEIEAITAVDLLRRVGTKVLTVGVGDKTVKGAHGIPIVCDITETELCTDAIKMVVIPGGMPGVTNLSKSQIVKDCILKANEQGAYIAAICAGPSLLGELGLLSGKEATCYPGFEPELTGATISKNYVCKCDNIITAKGPGVSLEFALMLAETLSGTSENFCEMKAGLQCREK